MRTGTTAALIATGLLALTACGGESADDKPTTAAATQTPTTTPEQTPEPPMTVGNALHWEDTTNGIAGTSAALSYKQGIKSSGTASTEVGAAGYEWAALELKVCSSKGTFPTSSSPWVLAYDDGGRVEASSSIYEDFPRPQYPVDATLTPGKCVRGFVVYPVPDDDRPASVIYTYGNPIKTAEWAVPAK
ncbi:hypothetical protein ACFU8Q_14535 [Streptomyces sp. NPDC057543]|uniref:hypothetical protein n=1 Tax=Streptomyces sp. NPDC057543 TaxID=3346163 RepID=UPI0036CDA014